MLTNLHTKKHTHSVTLFVRDINLPGFPFSNIVEVVIVNYLY